MSVPFDFEAITADGKVEMMTFRSWGVGDKMQYARCCSEEMAERVKWLKENDSAVPNYIGFRFYWEGVLVNFNWQLKTK